MLKISILLFSLLIVPASANQALKTIITIILGGTAAASDEELSQSRSNLEEKKKSLINRGLDPTTAASFEIDFKLDSSADAVYWADTIGNPDIFFILEASGSDPVAIPSVFDEYAGHQINQSLLGSKVANGGTFKLHVLDTDDSINGILNSFKNGQLTVGIPVQIGPMTTGVGVTFQGDGGQTQFIRPDYIGSIIFDPPKDDSIWAVSGEIEDVWSRTIGNFTVKQIPLLSEEEVEELQEKSVFWSFIKWSCITGAVVFIFSRFVWAKEKEV